MNDDLLPQATFRAVLDEAIPARDAKLPGAGSLGVGDYVAARLGDATPFVASGLAALDALARERGAAEFADLPSALRAPLLREVDANQPGFVRCILLHAYSSYYQHPRVMAAIGLAPRPPYPKGYTLEPLDPDLLEAVRGRAKLYREV